MKYIEKFYSYLTKGLNRYSAIVLLGIFSFCLAGGIAMLALGILQSMGVINLIARVSRVFNVFNFTLAGLLIILDGVLVAVLHRYLKTNSYLW